MPMDFTEVQKAGSRLGTGTMVVLDDQTCPVGMVGTWSISSRRNRAAGAHPAGAASIGQNRFCARWRKAKGSAAIWIRLEFQTKFLAPGNTFCAFAPGAVEPLQSALKYFRDDFERHIR